MQRKKLSPLYVAPAIANLLLSIGVMTVFSACDMKDDGTWMHCHMAQEAVMWVAIILAVILAANAFHKNDKLRTAIFGVGAIGSIVTFAIPGTIVSMCMMQTMRCYEIMQPFVRIMSVVILVLCVTAAVSSWRKATKDLPKRSL